MDCTMVQGVCAGSAIVTLTILMMTGCATSGTAQNMTHPDYSDAVLVAERKLAIDRCQQENTTTEFIAYENVAATDTSRGLAQQSRRVSQMSAMNEAVVACMRRNGWRF